jgi:methylated-DNA-protein-cysteine methyltransferase-like protein
MPVVEPRVVSKGFHARVYAVVRRIPPGHVATYGQIAAVLGSPRVARHVGFALAAAGQADEPVPWHRVVNAAGRLSTGGDPSRGDRQRRLLEDEGVELDARGRIDLARYRWTFPDSPPASA